VSCNFLLKICAAVFRFSVNTHLYSSFSHYGYVHRDR
jgi:hypothetical protein